MRKSFTHKNDVTCQLLVLREGPAHLTYHGIRIIRLVVVALEQQVSISKQKQFARLLLFPRREPEVKVWSR